MNEFVSGGALLIILGGLLTYFRNVPYKLYSLFERLVIIKIDVQEEDESFYWLKKWLAKELNHSLSISILADRTTEEKRPRIIFTPSPGWYWFTYKKRLVSVYKHRTTPEGKSEIVQKPRESFYIKIFSRNLNIAKSLVEEARNYAIPLDEKIEISASQYEYWLITNRVKKRPIESVVLEGNTTEMLLKDIKEFKKSSEWYTKLGIPYRRGYLLYGEPGNGKSSCVLALASELGMNVNVLNLSTNGLTDTRLIELLASVSINNIILIEDIDCAFIKREAATDRKDKGFSGLTFSGLLNALDGILAQEGRILFMTTNHLESLDPALKRPGRADVKVYIGNATKDQAYRLFARFYGKTLAQSFAEKIPDKVVSMAKIQHHLMLYKDDPRMAVKMVDQLLEKEEADEIAKAA